jgi:hypothetical protein
MLEAMRAVLAPLCFDRAGVYYPHSEAEWDLAEHGS